MSRNQIPLINKKILLEKFPGKGGWTFARLPEIPQEKRNPFGWKKVSGFIDDYEISHFHLMPMGNGQLFLPVKAEIRKKIKKEHGDLVTVVLYADGVPAINIKSDFLMCLEDEPKALRNFESFPENEQEKYLEWMEAAQTEDLRIKRMVHAIDLILTGSFLKAPAKGI
ncbi:MAG TPA: YdeI/OmpD-associated family protein [Sphingobacteriaceae bacterium]